MNKKQKMIKITKKDIQKMDGDELIRLYSFTVMDSHEMLDLDLTADEILNLEVFQNTQRLMNAMEDELKSRLDYFRINSDNKEWYEWTHYGYGGNNENEYFNRLILDE